MNTQPASLEKCNATTDGAAAASAIKVLSLGSWNAQEVWGGEKGRGGWPRAFAYSFLGLVHISYNIPKWSPRRNTYERQEGRGRKRCINACGCCTHSPLLLLQGQEGHVLMLGSAYFSPRGCVKLAQAAGRRDTRNFLERNGHR